MIELWSREDITRELSNERAFEMNQYALSQQANIKAGATVTIDDWRLLEFKFIPAESVDCVWHNSRLTVRVFADQVGATVKQVFRKSKMVEVISYVEAKDL
jgi:hypothetical protein